MVMGQSPGCPIAIMNTTFMPSEIAGEVVIGGVAIKVTLEQAEQMFSNLPKEAKEDECVLSKTSAIFFAYEVWDDEEICDDKLKEWRVDFDIAVHTLISIEMGTFDYEDIPY